MYPELFRIPWLDYPVSSFGVMMALGFLVAYGITARRFGELGLDVEKLASVLIWVMLGGVLGAKLYFAVDNWLQGNGPFTSLLLSRAGITWYGGLFGAVGAGAIGCRVHGLSFLETANAAAPATAVGQALGRVGCFLVGDDYGKATDLPWGVAFPQGAPPTFETVHPTQLYEVAWLIPVAGVLWHRRRQSPFLFGEYLAANGAGRIVIEEWRVNPEVALGLTEPQWIGVGLVLAGATGWWLRARSGARRAAA